MRRNYRVDALEIGHIGAGDVVVTQGTGGVSLYALQLAKARGATVILTSSSDEKLEVGRTLGADLLINYCSTPDWELEVRKLTEGRGADLVVDLGGEETLGRSVKATRVDAQSPSSAYSVASGWHPFPSRTR